MSESDTVDQLKREVASLRGKVNAARNRSLNLTEANNRLLQLPAQQAIDEIARLLNIYPVRQESNYPYEVVQVVKSRRELWKEDLAIRREEEQNAGILIRQYIGLLPELEKVLEACESMGADGPTTVNMIREVVDRFKSKEYIHA